MGNIFNEDFKDFLIAFNHNQVEYIVVGGYAVILHGYSRTTGDMDIWVNKTEDNYKKIVAAFYEFQMPIMGMTKEVFLHNNNMDVFTYGRPPVCIDIMTSVKGMVFEEAFPKSTLRKVDGIEVRLIDYRDLISAKKASGRHKDLDDIENIE
jgi:predicted nucleotidyltransferase